MSRCVHDELNFDCSKHAASAGYRRKTPTQRQAGAQHGPRKAQQQRVAEASTFPAPLVLPEDELAWDPTYETQRLKDWRDADYRNKVTEQRKTIYLVPTPNVSSKVAHVVQWASPTSRTKTSTDLPRPKIDDVLDYLKAFYHGLPVKLLSEPRIEYVQWDKTSGRWQMPQHIALNIGPEAIRIRARAAKGGNFSGQLNLQDLLDAAIAMLPKDAFAMLMLVDHDLYEDEEDDFCCGRAYGGSRVAVVSTARYNPVLDTCQNVERDHAWPASHCQGFMDTCCDAANEPLSRPKKRAKKTASAKKTWPLESDTAMTNAIRAFTARDQPPLRQNDTYLWLGRVCKTASHELGHCFGMDHCVYYACIMQGTAGLSEDARQPPYLCPVDVAKVLFATGANERERYQALLKLCEKFESGGGMFAAFAAWLNFRVTKELGNANGDDP